MSVYLETNLWNVLCDHPWMRARSWGRSVPAPSLWVSVIIASPKWPRPFGGTGLQPTVDDSSFPVFADSSMPAPAAPSKIWNSFLQN